MRLIEEEIRISILTIRLEAVKTTSTAYAMQEQRQSKGTEKLYRTHPLSGSDCTADDSPKAGADGHPVVDDGEAERLQVTMKIKSDK